MAHLPTLALCLIAQAVASPSPAPPSPSPRTPPNGPVVVVETTQGRFTIGLHQDKAPVSVSNFLRYVHSGHYDGTIFHRVIANFMIQGGGYTADLKEKPTMAPIRNEGRNGLRNSRGTVAMARTRDPDSATSQFFINVKDNHNLDFGIEGAGYAVFGEVLEGMDVVDRIRLLPTETRTGFENVPTTTVTIQSIREVPRKP